MHRAWFLLAIALIYSTPAVAADEQPEVFRETIHADLPLWTGPEALSPHGFTDADSFGCASEVGFGDWVLREKVSADANEDDETWFRLRNYGVFHCAVIVDETYERAALRNYGKLSYFVDLGQAQTAAGPRHLWALQLGVQPGSDYLLLARPAKSEPNAPFEVLQTQCPRGAARKGPRIDIFPTGYCVINTKADFRQLVRRMILRPARGTLSFVAPLADED